MAIVSLLAHGALLAGASLPARTEAKPAAILLQRGLAERAARLALPVSIAAARRALVDRARADRRRGGLALGAFVLTGNELDAREAGQPFDWASAAALYAERLEKLREALDDLPLREAAAAVFGDLHYYGQPGGRMGDALVDGGGSCEPIAQLVAAAMHDAGRSEAAWLRYYGGDLGDGVAHLAPVLVAGRDELDLLSGGPAQRTGALFPAADLVEVYARAHGLAAPLPARDAPKSGDGGGAKLAAADEPPADTTRSMATGYPPNQARFAGSIPLYASRAVHDPHDPAAPAAAAEEAREQATDCAFHVPMAVLDAPKIEVDTAAGGFAVELHRVPSLDQIDRTFAVIRAVEQAAEGKTQGDAERLMGAACLTALYRKAALDLTLASKGDLARLAADKERKAAEAGGKLVAAIDWSGPASEAVAARLTERFAGRNWLLLVLPGGERAVLRLVSGRSRDDWGRVSALAALAVHPATRAQTLALLDGRPRPEQLQVMHEVFHAQDHLRPWASNYALDGDARAAGDFARAYAAFRAVAWGLWESARPPEEVLDHAVSEARRARLDRGWEDALIDYYARNKLGVHQTRPDGRAIAARIARWMRDNGRQDLEIYRTRLRQGE